MKNISAVRLVASSLALLMALPAAPAAAELRPQSAPGAQAMAQPAASGSLPQQNQAQPSQANPAPSSSQQENATPAVGTAAAPYEKASGVTASRPAGAVIAPAKQHRVRRIFIRLGIVVGAGAAVAAVALLSHASPSRPH